jgi:hypothetical protein
MESPSSSFAGVTNADAAADSLALRPCEANGEKVSSAFDSIGKRARGTPAFSAATHTRMSCARTQAAAVGLAVAVAAVAVAVAAYASSGWCPAAVRRYGVVAAAALVVDCVALQTVWVGAVALWRWMTAPAVHPGARSSVYHPPYPLHGAWAPS